MPGMSLSTGSKDGKVFENQIGHGIVTEDGQARIDTAIVDTRAAKPGAAFSSTATEYINEIDQHRPKTLPSGQQRAEQRHPHSPTKIRVASTARLRRTPTS
jgi:hypothetical protein